MDSYNTQEQFDYIDFDILTNSGQEIDKYYETINRKTIGQKRDDISVGKGVTVSRNAKQKKASKAPLLPPCRVCGDQATGFHYGATTCEACKGFYRRSLTNKREYACVGGEGNCDVSYTKKAPCAACRKQKCLDAGMSKTEIRRGRYSISRKTKHIMEVKGLKTHDLSPAPSVTFALRRSNESDAIDGATSTPKRHPRKISENDSRLEWEEFSKKKEFVNLIYNSYVRHCRYPEELAKNLRNIHESYKRDKLSRRELEEPYTCQEELKLSFFRSRLPYIETSIQELVSFAKSIPGFKSIPMDDQIVLIKSVQFTWWMLSVFPGISNETEVYTTPLGDSISKEEMARFTGENYVNMWFNMGERLSRLNLDETELALLTALCVVPSGFAIEDLKDYAGIDKLHHEIGEALYFYTKCHKPSPRFGSIVATLTELRTAEDIHIEGKARAYEQLEELNIPVPKLILELWHGMVPTVDPEKVAHNQQSPQYIVEHWKSLK